MHIKKIFYGLIALVILMSATPSHAMYMVTEWLSWAEKKLQTVTEKLADIDMKDMLAKKKEQLAAQDPNADKGKAPAPDNKSGLTQAEIPPYVDKRIKAELDKEEPAIPAVEALLKDVLVYKSSTVSQKGSIEERTKGKTVEIGSDNEQDNTLEKQRAQALVTYDNARALARRIHDLSDVVSNDASDMESDKNSRTTTGSLYKGSASLTYKTHMLLNEIAVLRNSYLEVMAIDSVQAEEVPEKKSMIDSIKDAAKGALGG